MMGLDFARAAELFMGSEHELALALGITVADMRELRTNPRRASPELLEKLARVLIERGTAMRRVGEMLRDD
ncbi:MAG TPA: hypothetical protein VK864_11540 [Longimicrobiales bacterium]|nr:hypothetical protein [Longimicrobiales bacterium]